MKRQCLVNPPKRNFADPYRAIRAALVLATTGHYRRKGVIPAGAWGGAEHFVVKVAGGQDGELPLAQLMWDNGKLTAGGRHLMVLKFLETGDPTPAQVREFLTEVTARPRNRTTRQPSFAVRVHLSDPPGFPKSAILTLTSIGDENTPVVRERRREQLSRLLSDAISRGARLTERIPGNETFAVELELLTDQPPLEDVSKATAWVESHVNNSGDSAVYARLLFRDRTQKNLFIDEARVTEPTVQLSSEGGILRTNWLQFLGALDPDDPVASPAWHPSVAKVLAAAGISLPTFPNLVLEGVPGTGKTYFCDQIRKKQSEQSAKDDPKDFRCFRRTGEGRFAITLHPATSYEDFVEGLRPGKWEGAGTDGRWADVDSDAPTCRLRSAPPNSPGSTQFWHPPKDAKSEVGFSVQDGFFLCACREALHFPEFDFIVLLDEINRCNVPKVLGDLITTLEGSKRARWVPHESGDPLKGHWDLKNCQTVSLPYSGRTFFVPDNVYVIATMNTTDRSVAPLDSALRRRFAFKRMWPLGFPEPTGDTKRDGADAEDDCAPIAFEKLTKLHDNFGQMGINPPVPLPNLEASVRAWHALNRALLHDLGEDAMLGHSYLFSLKDDLEGGEDESASAQRLHRRRGHRFHAGGIIRDHWNQYILPQLADVLESNNAVDLLTEMKPPKMLGRTIVAMRSLSGFEKLLAKPEGTGMMRRAKLLLGE